MRVGVPAEIKNQEHRVGLTPASVRELSARGHEVLVQSGAGAGIGMSDEAYRSSGAIIRDSAAEVWAEGDLIVKVKEPQPAEFALMHRGQVLFTYLHLAPDAEQVRHLLAADVVAIAYETVRGPGHSLPLLSPMSEVAGCMAVQVGAHYLEHQAGGAGVLLGGIPGVEAARVLVLGGGVVGSHAVRVAMGMGAQVTVIDRSLPQLRALDLEFGSRLNTIYSTLHAVESQVTAADLVIGAVLVPGGAAPKLVSRAMVRGMRAGSVLVDVAIDQGGCFETSRPTTHASPVYVEEGVLHYCVGNMPGAVPRTSTAALNNATLPYVMALAEKGYRRALLEDAGLLAGLNIHRGVVSCEPVAVAQGLPFQPPEQVLR